MGPDATILVFWMLSFKPTFSLSSFSFIKRLLSTSSLSVIRVESSAYLRLLLYHLAILIPACALYSLASCMTYCAYKLNKQDDNIQPWYSSFLIWNQSIVPCQVLAVASWLAYRFLRRQVRWFGILFKNFPQFVVIYTVKGFSIVNETKVDIFLKFSCFFDDPTEDDNLISGSPAFSKSSLNIWKFWVLSSCTVVILGLLKISLTKVYVGVPLSQTTNCYAAGMKMDQMFLKPSATYRTPSDHSISPTLSNWKQGSGGGTQLVS